MALLSRLLANTGAKQLASLVSPAFFDVMPTGKLWARARELRSASRDDDEKRRALEARSETLRDSGLAISLTSKAAVGGDAEDAMPAERRADEVVALYFHQIYAKGPVIFDLRAGSFTARRDELVWHPKAWIVRFDQDFIEPLREIYRGFYEADDSLFRKGLTALDLQHAEDLFRKHFGQGQDAVRFRTRDFVETFHHVFVRCRDEGTRLHQDFLPLGLYLASLYDHLETLDVPVDVTRAYQRGSRVTGEG